MESETIEENNEIDIEELETILGINDKEQEISELFSSSNSEPKNFLQGISLIANTFRENSNVNDSLLFPEFKDVIINISNFFMSENSEKYKINFPKPELKKEEKTELKIKNNENKENKNISTKINNNQKFYLIIFKNKNK